MPDFIYNPPTTPWLDIVYQDDDIIAVNKPSGLLSNPGRSPAHSDSTWLRIREIFPDAQLVHRLDMSTSGLIVFGKHKAAECHLKAQFRERVTHKLYYARVWGNVEQDSGRIDLPLICDWPNRPKQKVCFEQGKPSVTDFEIIKREKKTTLVRLLPITGRSHQLRVHMLAREHPIVGDDFYAHTAARNYSPRLQLHAAELCILHPKTNEPMHLSAPCEFFKNAPTDTLKTRSILEQMHIENLAKQEAEEELKKEKQEEREKGTSKKKNKEKDRELSGI